MVCFLKICCYELRTFQKLIFQLYCNAVMLHSYQFESKTLFIFPIERELSTRWTRAVWIQNHDIEYRWIEAPQSCSVYDTSKQQSLSTFLFWVCVQGPYPRQTALHWWSWEAQQSSVASKLCVNMLLHWNSLLIIYSRCLCFKRCTVKK